MLGAAYKPSTSQCLCDGSVSFGKAGGKRESATLTAEDAKDAKGAKGSVCTWYLAERWLCYERHQQLDNIVTLGTFC